MTGDILKDSAEIFANIQEKAPVVHNISNYITATDCANMTLACGGSPTMADDPDEVEEIAAACAGSVINMGNTAGHISEVKFVGDKSSKANGVDAAAEDLASEDTIDGIAEYAKKLSERLNTVIAISGPIDVVADANKAYLIRNGHPMMSRVTGTGCMLSSAVGVFAAANPDNLLEATAVCISAYGYAGELAYEKVQSTNGGTGSFRMFLMDAMSNMDNETFLQGAKIEEV